jgi:hypothetical protein
MKRRCLEPKHDEYKNYGGRGIKVCERWLSFKNFLADMGVPPEGRTLDRIDNDGDYTPENCRWATTQEQRSNTRANRLLTFRGKTQPLFVWAKETGIQYTVLKARFYNGWPVERLLTEPIRQRRV